MSDDTNGLRSGGLRPPSQALSMTAGESGRSRWIGAQWGSSRRLTTVASAANATARRYRRHVTTLPCPMTSGLAEEVAARVEEPNEPELLERRRGDPRQGGRDRQLPRARLARRPDRPL